MRRTKNILIVEDTETDLELTLNAFELLEMKCHTIIAKDGEAALDAVYRKGAYENEKKPDLILLDLNLPKKNGIDVLKTIKADEKLKNIPVIILSTSDDQEQIDKCYQAQASGYLIKSFALEDFMKTMSAFKDFWLNSCKLSSADLMSI